MKMKQILAGVLTAAMVLTCAPATALAAADSSANAEDTTLQPGANIVRDEVIFIPNEDGTFPEVDSTTNPEVMDFLNGLSSIVVTVAYKYTDTAQLKPSTYPLFSMEGENGRHFTVRTSPQRSGNTGNSDFTYAYTGSKNTLKWGTNVIAQDTKWHKYSLSITKKPYSETETNGYNTVVVDGKQVITNNWNMSGHYPEGHLCGDNAYTKVHIGKQPDDKSRLTNVGES